MNCNQYKIELDRNGFSKTEVIYNECEVLKIIKTIESIDQGSESVIKTKALFAIRQLIIVKPELWNLLLNKNLLKLIKEIGGPDFYLTKAIYFDKPKSSNWFVSYHQDLSINVSRRKDVDGYKNWTSKRNQLGVQPPTEVLENIFTIRIHLDDTDRDNGALKVIPKSHVKGVIRKDKEIINSENEVVCTVRRGECMLMRPLIIHASNRTVNEKQRRVIHLEFSNKELEKPLEWKEYQSLSIL